MESLCRSVVLAVYALRPLWRPSLEGQVVVHAHTLFSCTAPAHSYRQAIQMHCCWVVLLAPVWATHSHGQVVDTLPG